jgi:hypothetical protein
MLPQLVHAHGRISLGQTLSGGITQKRDMGISRCRHTQQTVKIQLLGRGQQQVATAHHFRHPHRRIVHHDRKLIGPRAVGTAQHKVATMVGKVALLPPEHAVLKVYNLIRHIQHAGTTLLQHQTAEKPMDDTFLHILCGRRSGAAPEWP